MSMATRTDRQSPALHVADSHDLIRVQGARVNNLKDVSVEIPKRRLTVFTGVSGSGKSSLVFDTIAAESQRLTTRRTAPSCRASCPRWRGRRSTCWRG
jgi:excinuclease UvrABC ATPase subunit